MFEYYFTRTEVHIFMNAWKSMMGWGSTALWGSPGKGGQIPWWSLGDTNFQPADTVSLGNKSWYSSEHHKTSSSAWGTGTSSHLSTLEGSI